MPHVLWQEFEYEAELVDTELQISSRLTATRPIFRFIAVRPGNDDILLKMRQ
jgi:hypothetical protein